LMSKKMMSMLLTLLFTCTKLDAVPLSDPSRSHIRPDTRFQIKERKNQQFHPAAWNSVHWLPRYASTIVYRCITLLQLLYRWQHQSENYGYPAYLLFINYNC
jgi:hypothetical protein